ncbi:hypothetical protein [Pseudomonas sp. F(2018)]|uniref:hypothetical protein n=1 Tax=Pseudomonas sp. F(2018) TaxID=2502240 RepID=UPI0010F8B132|nr:hypothetical protein [Pseudomonas sp. F(2018)]
MPHLHPLSHNFRDKLYAFAPVGAAAHQLPCSGVFSLSGASRISANLKLSAGVDSLFEWWAKSTLDS